MALIGKIRNNSWLLIVLIGLGLGGFLLMDMTQSPQSLFGGDQNSIGSIAGKSIEAKEFFKTEDVLYSGSNADVFTRRNTLWNFFLEKEIVNEEAAELGLTITQDEFAELQFGNNLSNIISSSFRNPQTGQVDRAQLNQIKAAIESGSIENPNFAGYWREIQKQVKKDALQQKLNNLVSKGMYTPSWMVDQFSNDQNQKVDFEYVRIPFSNIDNADIKLTDADYSSYLNSNMGSYAKDEETRQVGYVSFDIKPSAQDTLDIVAGLNGNLEGLRNTPNESIATFVSNQSGDANEAYFKKEALNATVAAQLFDADLGSVYGPYIDGTDYKVAKLVDRKVIPDSVEARHILINILDPTMRSVADNKIDSLMTALENGADFGALATQHSMDQGSKILGGELGYSAPGRMVKPFNDMIFFKAKKGEYNVVESQFGIHIIEVTGQKFLDRVESARVVYLRTPIIPSSKTQKQMYKQVGAFINGHSTMESLQTAAAEDANLDYNTSLPVAKNDYSIGTLGSSQSTREMIKFAFKGATGMGDVSKNIYTFRDPIENYDNKYVVATLESKIPAGNPSVSNVKDQIENAVINAAKAKMISGKISGSDLNAIANQFESSVDSVSNAAFTATFLQGLGNEPQVVATAFNMNNGEVSKPIEGKNGVYIIKLINKQNSGATPNVASVRSQVSRPYQAQVAGQLMESLKKGMEIDDNRSTYY